MLVALTVDSAEFLSEYIEAAIGHEKDKASYQNFKKNYVPNVAYRKDNVMPARNLKEYLQKRGQAKFYV